MSSFHKEILIAMSTNDKTKVIEPEAGDIRIEVGPDGVFIGFFSGAKLALVNVDVLAASGAISEGASAALRSWAADRREQAAA